MRLPFLAIVFLFVFGISVDYYIFKDLRRLYPHRRVPRIYLAISIVLLSGLLVCVSLPRRNPEESIVPVMWMLYGYLSVYIPKFLYLLFSVAGRVPCIWKRKQLNLGLYAGVPVALVMFVSMWWGALVTRNQIEVKSLDIEFADLPPAFDGYRIVQFSDLHTGTRGSDTVFVSRLVDSINSLKPDVVFFTGDIVNRVTSELKPFLKPLSRIKAKDGVYSVLGNHDYGDYADWPTQADKDSNNRLMAYYQKSIGWELLNNRTSFIHIGKDSIAVIGVENWGEPPFKQYGDLNSAYPMNGDTSSRHLNDSTFKILLSHNPEHWRQEVSINTNVDLTLSGHTHAMQFVVGLGNWRWSPAKWKYEEWGGLYSRTNKKQEDSRIYVNIGCGEVGMPYRIGATPEITLITLRKKQ